MAKFITFNGITYVHPGAVSKVDVTALAQVSGSATGIVALVGEAEGGQPNMVSDSTDPNFDTPKIYTFFDPANAKATLRGGPLADAINLAFDAANDPRIGGGASQVLAIKTNQDTPSTAAIPAHYNPARTAANARTKDYGAHTGNVQIEFDVSAADALNNETVVTITDNSTGTIETLNNVAGKSLIDVQYRGIDSGNVIFSGTTTVTAVTDELVDAGAAFTPGGSASAAEGNWVRITAVPDATATPANRAFVGQCRRIRTGGAGAAALQLETAWLDDSNAADFLPTGTSYEVVRECVGPFLAVDDTTGATTYTDVAGGADTVVFPAQHNAGTEDLYSVENTSSDQFVSTGVFKLGTDVAGGNRYDLSSSGPNYIKIVSGPGAGQIREISTATATMAGPLSDIFQIAIDPVDAAGWSPVPTAASQFVFVNVSKGTATQNGAEMSVTGTTGAAVQLALSLRPGSGDWNGAASIGMGAAGALSADITVPIAATTTASEVINLINSPATPGVSLSQQGWFARIGTGRVTTELASDLDWDGIVNTSVFACCGFDQLYRNTWGITSSSAPVTAVKKNRLMDNLTQLIDAVNAQSALVTLTKATTAVTDGDGMALLNFPAIALTGGTAASTTTTDLLNAYDDLNRHRHNTVVPLWSTDGPSISLGEVHAATLSHTNLGSGAAKNENDGILAIDVSGTPATALVDVQNSQADLNNRNCALVYQGVQRTNVDGAMTQFEPHMLAVILAGMQAGTEVGEPLTFKYLRSNDLTYPNTLDPKDVSVSNQLLLSGILFAEPVQGKGFRVVRNLSTYTQTDNLAYTDRNVNEVLNYVSYDLRTFIEDRFTGIKATPATAASIKSSLISKLSSYRDADIIVDSTDTVTGQRLNAYRNVRVSISGDIATIRFEMFPVIGINYEIIEIFAQLPTISA